MKCYKSGPVAGRQTAAKNRHKKTCGLKYTLERQALLSLHGGTCSCYNRDTMLVDFKYCPSCGVKLPL